MYSYNRNFPFDTPELSRIKRRTVTRVDIIGCGGKVMLGKANDHEAAYWRKHDPAAFGTHLLLLGLDVGQRLDGGPVKPRSVTKGLNKRDVMFDGGIEMEGTIEIKAVAEDGTQLLDYLQQPDEPAWPVSMVDDRRFFQTDAKSTYFMARTFDSVCSTFIVEANRPFDPDLLDLNIFLTGWGAFIDSIFYDGQVIKPSDQMWLTAKTPKAMILQQGSN
jgi:hypothetical protein